MARSKRVVKPAKKIRYVDPLERLTPDDRQALVAIGTLPGCELGRIQAAAGCNKGAAQRTVKRLLEKGLIRRNETRRPYRHFCTTKGYKLRERVCQEA